MKSTETEPDNLISLIEVARIYGAGKSTIRDWCTKKDEKGAPLVPLPVINRPRFVRWSKNQIHEAIEQIKAAARKEQIT